MGIDQALEGVFWMSGAWYGTSLGLVVNVSK